MPFGPGQRTCPRQHLAMTELPTALAHIAGRSKIEIDGDLVEAAKFATWGEHLRACWGPALERLVVVEVKCALLGEVPCSQLDGVF